MKNLQELELHELVTYKDNLDEEIVIRTRVVKSGIEVEHGYLGKLKEYQAKKRAVINAIDEIYNGLNEGIKDGYQFMEDVWKRERDKMSIDDDGNPILEVAHTGISPIDDHLFLNSNSGIPFGNYMGVIGESNSGKSDIVYMMIKGFINDKHKVHLHSYELGEYALYKTLSSDQHNKLRNVLDIQTNHKMLSVDTQSYELSDLIRIMRLRALDGCRIFILDSLPKVTINGDKADIEIVSEEIRRATHDNSLLTVVVGQKSKYDIENDIYQIYGSIQVQHHFDIMLFIELENKHDREATRRILWLEKNREEKKMGVISDYDMELHELKYIEASSGIKQHDIYAKAGADTKLKQTNSKFNKWIYKAK